MTAVDTIDGVLDQIRESGAFGVWLGGLDGRPAYTHDPDRAHYSASTMKLPVAIAMMRLVETGALSLDQPVLVHNDFASAQPGQRFGVRRDQEDAAATWDRMGERVPLSWLASEMITRSGNLATDLVLELTGLAAADRVLKEFGSGRSAIRRGIDDRVADAAGIRNEMTAADFAGVLLALGNDKAVSAESSAYLRDLLAGNVWAGEIPAGVPPGTRVEHKNGWVPGIRHDAGIVRPPDADPFVLAVFTTSELPDERAQRVIADITTIAWEHRHDLASIR